MVFGYFQFVVFGDRKSTRLNSSHANLVCRLLLEKKRREESLPRRVLQGRALAVVEDQGREGRTRVVRVHQQGISRSSLLGYFLRHGREQKLPTDGGTRSLRSAMYKCGDNIRPRNDLDHTKSRSAKVDTKIFFLNAPAPAYLSLFPHHKLLHS